MNISAQNYGKIISTLNVPPVLKPDFEGVKEFTKNYTDWSVYKDPTVKQWFDLYFKNLANANKSAKVPAKKPLAKKTAKNAATKIKPIVKEKPIAAKKVKRAGKAPSKKLAAKASRKAKPRGKKKAVTIYNKAIPKTGSANPLLRRFAGFIGKYKPVTAIIKLYQDIELAFKQNQSIKNSQHYDVLVSVQKKLAKVADQYETAAPGTTIQINLASKDLFNKIRAIASNQAEDKFTMCEKRFIRMQGKKPFPIAVRKLLSDFEKIDMNGSNPKVKEYIRMIKRILNDYLNKKSKTVEVTPSIK